MRLPKPIIAFMAALAMLTTTTLPAYGQYMSVPENPVRPYRMTLHTNALAWTMAVANVGVEFEIDGRYSIKLPIYYSGWNYFHRDLKFRTLTVLPEARVWISGYGKGLYVNVHGGFCYYNVALGGAHRYQDHGGRTPSWGGGAGIGYRFNFCNDPKWQMEVGLGGGVYHLDYDIFENRINGPLIGRNHRTFFGIDNVSVSFTYTFDLRRRKKGGEQ